eukprot:jgi/Phyca11/100678/e_gw1.5.1392.1
MVKDIKLRCGAYGEGSVFSVKIKQNADVEALQLAIVNARKGVNNRFNVDPSTLTLYLAGKQEGEEIKWLKDEDSLGDELRGVYPKQYMKMRSSRILDEDYFGENFQPGRHDVHVLVELPEKVSSVQSVVRAVFWLVTGLVENALQTRGVHRLIYRIADAQLGYYDPANMLPDNKPRAFWYTNNDLQFHVLFKEGECVHCTCWCC